MNRREFLTGTFLRLFVNPQSDYNPPKFKIGDYVEYRWIDEHSQGYERGTIVGVLAPNSGNNCSDEWLYFYEIQECSYKPCIGFTGQTGEDSLALFY